jgi:hypothetical protein
MEDIANIPSNWNQPCLLSPGTGAVHAVVIPAAYRIQQEASDQGVCIPLTLASAADGVRACSGVCVIHFSFVASNQSEKASTIIITPRGMPTPSPIRRLLLLSSSTDWAVTAVTVGGVRLVVISVDEVVVELERWPSSPGRCKQ